MYVDEYFDGLAEYQAARARAFAHIDLVYRYGTQMTLDAKKKPKPRPRPRPGNGY